MSFNKFIIELEKSNPKLFKATKMQISASEFKNQLFRAYDYGYEDGLKDGKNSKSLFEKVFGSVN